MVVPRARKPVETAPPKQRNEDTSESISTKRREELDIEPNTFVVIGATLIFFLAVGSAIWYKVDNRDGGPFASWVDQTLLTVPQVLNGPSARPFVFGAFAQETKGELKLTEEDLKAYDGTDKDKPIYLAIDGTIFDVSSSPAFYGPGGHYHHFVGKDATRAWITECWDEPEQFTWRLDDVEVMFMNKYLDESLEAAGSGDFDGMGDLGESAQKAMGDMAKKAMARLGSVTDSEKKKRRKADVVEANAKVKETLEHWKKFFSSNDKYKIVGEVILDETRPAPPKPCKKAMEKRPLKGGKLESLMGANIMGGGAGQGKGAAGKGAMPDFVKKMQEDKKKKEQEKTKEKTKAKPKQEETVEEVEIDDDDEVYHEEL